MLSTERRVERYRIIYLWKIIRGLVPNCGLSWGTQGRRGLLVQLPPLSGSRASIRTLREHSFLAEAPRLFNSLPASIREHQGTVLSFKRALDDLLGSIPDAPSSETRRTFVTDLTGLASNSLKDWLRALGRPTYTRLIHETAMGHLIARAG